MKAQFNSFGGFATPIMTKSNWIKSGGVHYAETVVTRTMIDCAMEIERHENKMWYERDPVVASFLEISKKQSEKYGVKNVDK